MASLTTESVLADAVEAPAAPSRALTPEEIETEVLDLFDHHRNGLLRYVLSLGVATPDGEEITQEVFLALCRHLRAGGGRQHLRGWLFRVGHNLACRHCRDRRRGAWRGGAAAPAWAEAPDPDPDPEQRLQAAERRHRLLAVARALPEREQQCLALRFEGLSYREIAHTLGVSLGSVALALTRAMERLARAMGD